MAKSTERHARETRARIAKQFNISAELVRRSKIIKETFTDGQEAIMSGEYKVNTLYKLAIGDTRVGLHILIPPELRDAIRQTAKARGQTINDMLTDTLTNIFWYE